MFLITVPESLSTSLIGMLVVFAALVSLMAIIKLISAAAIAIDKGKHTELLPSAAAPAPVSAPRAGMVPAKGSQGEINLYDTDEKSAAMVMAIIADELKAPLNELRFISIRTK